MIRRHVSKNSLETLLNVLYVKELNIFPSYITKQNLNCEKKSFF